MKALTLFVAALIISFLSFGNELSLTTYFSTANSLRLRRREYLTAQTSTAGTVSLEKKTPVRVHICKRPIVRQFLALLGLEISAPPASMRPFGLVYAGVWLSIDPPPTPPPIFSFAA